MYKMYHSRERSVIIRCRPYATSRPTKNLVTFVGSIHNGLSGLGRPSKM